MVVQKLALEKMNCDFAMRLPLIRDRGLIQFRRPQKHCMIGLFSAQTLEILQFNSTITPSRSVQRAMCNCIPIFWEKIEL
jgi:hypothetical protein